MDWGSISSWFATLDYGNVADWFSATGTIFAAVSALYIAQRKPSDKIILKDYKTKSGLQLSAVNAGEKSVKLTSGPIYLNGERVLSENKDISAYSTKDILPGTVIATVLLLVSSRVEGDVLAMFFNNNNGKRYDISIHAEKGEIVVENVKIVNLFNKFRKQFKYNRK